jgi:hypothetical protein
MVVVDINTALGSSATTRLWNILVTQIGCNDPWRYRPAVKGIRRVRTGSGSDL